MAEMNVMLNEIRLRGKTDPEWSGIVDQAERLYEGHARSALTTLYNVITSGALPWSPENCRRLGLYPSFADRQAAERSA